MAVAIARTAADLCGVNRVTMIYFFRRLRQIVELETTPDARDLLGGEVEVDESYFGGPRKGQRGRGAAGKVPVFGLLKRGGRVYAQVVPNARTRTLKPIIRAQVKPDSIVYTDSLKSYDALDVSEFRHIRSITRGALRRRARASMGSRISGAKRSATCANTMAFRWSISACF